MNPTFVVTTEYLLGNSSVRRAIWRTSAVKEGRIVRLFLGVEESLTEVVEVAVGLQGEKSLARCIPIWTLSTHPAHF